MKSSPTTWERFLKKAFIDYLTLRLRRAFQYQYRKREGDLLRFLTTRNQRRSLSGLTRRRSKEKTFSTSEVLSSEE